MQDEQQQRHEDAQNEAFSLVLVTVLQGHTSDEIRLSGLLPFQGLPTWAMLPENWRLVRIFDGFGGNKGHGCVCHVGGKTIRSWIVLHIVCVEVVPLRRFSGQDTVRTPTRLHPQSSSMPLRTQLSHQLKVLFLSTTFYTTPEIDHNYEICESSVFIYRNKQTGAKTQWVSYIVIHYWLHPSYRAAGVLSNQVWMLEVGL